jgi:hypothetical protein
MPSPEILASHDPFREEETEGIRITANAGNDVVANIPPFLLASVAVLQYDRDVSQLNVSTVRGLPE